MNKRVEILRFIIIVILFVIARLFLQNLASRCFSYNVSVDDLRRGMILSKSLVKPAGKNYYAFMNEREKNKTYVDTIVHPSAEGLTIQDLKKIRKAFLENRVKDKAIPVVAHTCFGPYIFAGTMLAILMQGNIIVVAANVLGNI